MSLWHAAAAVIIMFICVWGREERRRRKTFLEVASPPLESHHSCHGHELEIMAKALSFFLENFGFPS